MHPLLSPEEYRNTEKLVQEFLAGEGSKLHEELQRLDKESPTSWLAGFWSTMYLTIRDPLPINVTPFLLLKEDPKRNSQVRILMLNMERRF